MNKNILCKSKENLLRNVTAINELITTYELSSLISSDEPKAKIIAKSHRILYDHTNDKEDRDCPLCLTHKHACGDCAWVIFTGKTCYSKFYQAESFSVRLERLRNWKHKLLTRLLEMSNDLSENTTSN